MRSNETLDEGAERDAERASPRPGFVRIWAAGAPAIHYHSLVPGQPLTIGRVGGHVVIELDDDLASRRHAAIEAHPDGPTVTDLGSRNGVWLDGGRVQSALLRDGSLLRVGHTLFLYTSDLRALSGSFTRIDGALIGPRERLTWERIARLAERSTHLLIRGESGTGKELAARAFHRVGGPEGRPFVAVNCAAIPEGVAERLLFGATKGAYSGANADAPGYVQAAHGGTLFLDEFGELDLRVQAKLLRFLESGEALAVGAVRPHRLDVRVCLATNRELRDEVRRRAFREDLYYRVAEPAVTIPPLRERRESIPWLIQDVLDAIGGRSAHALFIEEALLRPWPGNVRELRMAVCAASSELELSRRTQLLRADLPDGAGASITPAAAPIPAPTPEPPETDPLPVRITDDAVRGALEATQGNISAAARQLGVHRNQIRRWLSKHEEPRR